MLNKTVRQKAGIPQTFSLSKYDFAKQFALEEWATNIGHRAYCAFLIGRAHSASDTDRAYWSGLASNFATNLLVTPNVPVTSSDGGMFKNICGSNVRDLTVMGAFYGGSEDERLYEYFEAFHRYETSNAGEPVDTSLLDEAQWLMYEKLGIDDENQVTVTVDLDGSEEKIVEDFVKWLRETRAAKNVIAPKKRAVKSDFSDWCRYQVLPYLDLTHWAAVQNAQLSQQILGVTLFPDDIDINVADRVRRVVAPLARSICNSTFANSLQGQVAGLAP